MNRGLKLGREESNPPRGRCVTNLDPMNRGLKRDDGDLGLQIPSGLQT